MVEPELWDVAAVAAHIGVRPATVTSYLARGRMPPAEYVFGGRPVWRAETIKAWHASRPGRPGRPRRH